MPDSRPKPRRNYVRPLDLVNGRVDMAHGAGGRAMAQLIDELFLTLAPQVAGRDDGIERPGFVSGKLFAPENPVWGTLVGLKRGGDHLLLRYAFARPG